MSSLKPTRAGTFVGVLVVILVVTATLICVVAANDLPVEQTINHGNHKSKTTTTTTNIQQSHVRTRARLMQSMLDFVTYKQLFHKTYTSLVEELTRQKLYLSRAFRAFVSAIRYKYHHLSYFLSVNDMSDQSPAELELMDNKVLEKSMAQLDGNELFTNIISVKSNNNNSQELLPELFEVRPLDEIEAKIEQYIESDGDIQRELHTQSAKRRRKRDTRATRAPLVSGPYEEMHFYNIKKSIQDNDQHRQVTKSHNNEDLIYFDHRQSGCLFEPRRQGKCGCCYAFSLIAYMEWLYCSQSSKGLLVALSEQYLIDCGRKRLGNLDGCSGGGHYSIGKFLFNFGMELRTNYPYRMREDQCPYEDEAKLSTTGQIRFGSSSNFNVGSIIPMSEWDEYIQYAPMIISLTTLNTNFKEYGGGVYDGAGCAPEANSNHMMLMVGHGREEGQDYWLIRNSYSVGWGEEGYYKLAKSADCVRTAKGYMYGTRDGGKTFAGKPSKNVLNNQSFVRHHYAANMAADLAKWEV